jgi:hypothetical protein
LRDLFNAVAEYGTDPAFGTGICGGAYVPYYLRWVDRSAEPFQSEADYFAGLEADFLRDFGHTEQASAEIVPIPNVPALTIGNFGYGVITNLYDYLPEHLAGNVRVIVPTNPDTQIPTMEAGDIADALEEIAAYIREGGTMPRLAGAPFLVNHDAVFYGELAEALTTEYRTQATNDAEWGQSRGIEWTV